MSDALPLSIKKQIRDEWNSPTSSVQVAIENLKSTLGHTIQPSVQWPQLWDSLKDTIDKDAFVPLIATLSTEWYVILNRRLDNESYAEWTDKFLALFTDAQLDLRIEASRESTRPSTRLTPLHGVAKSLYLYVPLDQGASRGQSSLGFEQDFDSLFEEGRGPEVGEKGRYDEHRATGSTGSRRAPITSETSTPRALPSLNGLTRPSELLSKTSPHILTVETGNPILVQSSHQRSLELLAGYLNKWGKPNRNDGQKRNILAVDLIESDFAMGVIDGLRIEPANNFGRRGPVNPTIVLSFIEGVLGYHLVHTTGERYLYRSDSILQ